MSNKFSSFTKGKNPFNKNTKTSPAIFKKGSVMFDENYNGIISTATIYISNYYEIINNLGYYDTENNEFYYLDSVENIEQKFHVNYLK